MIKFDTKLKLTDYLATTSPREGTYTVIDDETLQGIKSVYEYRNGVLRLLSENIPSFNWRTSVATFADVANITSPIGMDAVVVLADETHSSQPTQYYYNGYTWVYNGIYFKEALEIQVSDRNTRGSDITAATNYTIPLKYVVGSGHLHIYYDDIILVSGVDFTEVGTDATVSNVIKFTNSIANQARLIFKRVISNKFDETVTARRGKVDVYYFDTFTDALNSPFLKDEGQVLYTFGHTTKNDGKGRYWILEATDKDFAYKNKANTLFINRMIDAGEIQVGTMFPLASGVNAPPESVVMSGQIANRADYKRIWAWAQANGRVVTEAEVAANPGCFSSGDLSTTFRFPSQKDFIRGWDGTIAVGTYQADAFQGHNHSTSNGTGFLTYAPSTSVIGLSGPGGYNFGSTTANTIITDGTNGTPRTSTETRPKNTTQKYFIKI